MAHDEFAKQPEELRKYNTANIGEVLYKKVIAGLKEDGRDAQIEAFTARYINLSSSAKAETHAVALIVRMSVVNALEGIS